MIQYMKISKCSPPYKQTERKIPHDHLIRYRNVIEHNTTSLRNESPGGIRGIMDKLQPNNCSLHQLK